MQWGLQEILWLKWSKRPNWIIAVVTFDAVTQLNPSAGVVLTPVLPKMMCAYEIRTEIWCLVAIKMF